MVGVLKFENKRLRIRCYLLTTAYTTGHHRQIVGYLAPILRLRSLIKRKPVDVKTSH